MKEWSGAVAQGKALALAVRGLIALEDASGDFGPIEGRVRPQMIKLYRRELRRILAEVSKDEANEILAIVGPNVGVLTKDPSMN